MSSGRTVGAMALKFLSAICQCLKVCLFNLFVNHSSRFYNHENKYVGVIFAEKI